MRYKTIMVLAILLACLLTVSVVSATDNTSDIVSVEETTDEVVSDVGTFDELSSLIGNASEGDILQLDKEYRYVNGSTEGIQIEKNMMIEGNGHEIDGNYLSKIFTIYDANVTINNLIFSNANSKDYASPAISISSSDKVIISNCSFINNINRRGGGGAITANSPVEIYGCNFINNSAMRSVGGAIYLGASDSIIDNCNFIENYGEANGRGHAIFIGTGPKNISISNSYFSKKSAENEPHGCMILASYVTDFSLSNCTFFTNGSYSVNYESSMDCNIINCSFEPEYNNILSDYEVITTSNDAIIFLKKSSTKLIFDSLSFDYNSFNNLEPFLFDENDNELVNKRITFVFNKNGITDTIMDYWDLTTLYDKLNQLSSGTWEVTVIFEGNDNYYPCNDTATITVFPANSSLTIDDVNTTWDSETTFTAHVNSNNNTINEGTVTFFDGKTEIGQSNVNSGVATLTYTPTTAGEHTITAVFNSDNYLRSNCTAKLFVDTATVEVLVDNGTVGFGSEFVANVKGLYSTINEGSVSFYINDEYLGKVNVVNGVASISYMPLNANTYTIKVVYGDSVNFLDAESIASYTVNKADSRIIINDISGTVGHELTIVTNIISSNNLTINEGTVSFFDGETEIGMVNVNDGIATLTYSPTTAGEHTIAARYYSGNYQESIQSALLSVAKANVELTINSIADVCFTEQSVFTVNVNSNNGPVREGEVKFYVNDAFVGLSDIYDGVASFSYVTDTTGSFTLTAVYSETENYLTSNTTGYFTVNKMPTTLSGETTFFDEDEYKTYSTALINANGQGVANQVTKLEVIKYSGESRTFTGVSGSDGITIYDLNNLEGGMWIVRGVFDENDNYVGSIFTDRFIVIRMNTTTTIEEITNPRVNHTYKLKANIHDENGKLVKEGIVQFYLDGVDIGSIDLSKNQGHQSPLLSALNPMFECIVGVDDSDVYLEYTPSKAGKFTLSAVYEGTTVYKSSNSTTDFFVSDGKIATKIRVSGVSVVYGDVNGKLVATLKDVNGNPVGGADVSVILNDKEYSLITDSNGKVNVSTGYLAVGSYVVNITYDGDDDYNSSAANAKVTVKENTVISAKYNDLEVIVTLKAATGSYLGDAHIRFNLNGKTTIVKTNSKGQAEFPIAKLPAGNHTATISYSGNTKYNPTNKTVNIVVKEDVYISAWYDAANSEIVITLTNHGKAISGASVQVNLNGVYTNTQSNSKGKVFISTADLNDGTYTATISSKEGSYYKHAIKSITFTKIYVAISAVYDASNSEIVATLTNSEGKALSSANVEVNLNGVTNTVKTNSKGQVKVSTADLPSGNYTASISYAGNSKYSPASTSIDFTTQSKINIIIDAAYDAGNNEIVATLTNAATGKAIANTNVKVSFNGETTTLKTNSKGQVKVSTAGFALGTYPATFSYAGNSKYNAASTSINVEVKTKVIVTDVYAYSDRIVAKLTNGATGKFIANANMIVEINGVKYDVKSDNKGQLTFNTTGLDLPDSYDLTISYRGNDRYTASSATVAVDLGKANMMITTNYHADKQKLVATLKNSVTGKKVCNANMIIDLNGVKTTYKSNDQGKITLPTADFAPGTYVGTVTYPGNARYNSISAAFKVDI